MKNLVKKSLAFTAVALLSVVFYSQAVSAHGYIEEPASRAYLGKLGVNIGVGSAQYEPQSIEAPKGFPAIGPADGQIPGGGLAGFAPLNDQTINRWYKHDINDGELKVTWFITAAHSTAKWHYYMTKEGWNPNQPITRSDLELITEIQDNGSKPNQRVVQNVKVPANRTGYHVILGVWDIDDTVNAFYQVIDVNVNGTGGEVEEDKEAPSIPNQLKSDTSFNRVSLTWLPSTDNVGVEKYEILRDGQIIGESRSAKFDDLKVAENTTYTYQVRSIDFAGNKSAYSEKLVAKTGEKPVQDTEAPTKPAGLISHMITTNSTMLHWDASVDNVAVSHYDIHRDGKKIATTSSLMYTDKALKPSTTYSYVVYAVDTSGNRSEASKVLKVTTKDEIILPENEWAKTKVYTGGQKVEHKGLTYRAKWWTQGEVPGEADVWELITQGVTVDWTPSKAYQGGEEVVYNGKTYQAKWWTKGDKPSTSDVWKEVK